MHCIEAIKSQSLNTMCTVNHHYYSAQVMGWNLFLSQSIKSFVLPHICMPFLGCLVLLLYDGASILRKFYKKNSTSSTAFCKHVNLCMFPLTVLLTNKWLHKSCEFYLWTCFSYLHPIAQKCISETGRGESRPPFACRRFFGNCDTLFYFLPRAAQVVFV